MTFPGLFSARGELLVLGSVVKLDHLPKDPVENKQIVQKPHYLEDHPELDSKYIVSVHPRNLT